MEQLSYETAKELKDAGFPQNLVRLEIPIDEYTRHQYTSVGYHITEEHQHKRSVFEFNKEWYFSKKGQEEIVYIPTLSELIEACGEGFAILTKYAVGGWGASNDYQEDDYKVGECSECHREQLVDGDEWKRYSGKSPTEAVARLWLALHDKDNT